MVHHKVEQMSLPHIYFWLRFYSLQGFPQHFISLVVRQALHVFPPGQAQFIS